MKNRLYLFYGEDQRKLKRAIIERIRNIFIIEAPHPSPLSAHRGFFGSKPYSKINEQLIAWGEKPIDWNL